MTNYGLRENICSSTSRLGTSDDQTLAADARLTQRLVNPAAVIVRRAPVHLQTYESAHLCEHTARVRQSDCTLDACH